MFAPESDLGALYVLKADLYSEALSTLIFLITPLNPKFAPTSILAAPPAPFLVVMRITPLAPREPYMAAADASFNTSIDAISAGLI